MKRKECGILRKIRTPGTDGGKKRTKKRVCDDYKSEEGIKVVRRR